MARRMKSHAEKSSSVLRPTRKRSIMAFAAIARSEARKREGSPLNPPIRALKFVAELGVYIAVYEVSNQVNAYRKNAR